VYQNMGVQQVFGIQFFPLLRLLSRTTSQWSDISAIRISSGTENSPAQRFLSDLRGSSGAGTTFARGRPRLVTMIEPPFFPTPSRRERHLVLNSVTLTV
jgi:hypothetical protein